MFKIGFSLVLCLRLHLLLMYHQVHQQHNGIYFFHCLLVPRFLLPSFSMVKSQLLLLLLLVLVSIYSKSDYQWSLVSVSTCSCIIKFNRNTKVFIFSSFVGAAISFALITSFSMESIVVVILVPVLIYSKLDYHCSLVFVSTSYCNNNFSRNTRIFISSIVGWCGGLYCRFDIPFYC